MLHHPSGLLSNCDAGGHDDDDHHHLPLPDFLALLPSTRLPDDGCFLFLPLKRFVLFFLHFEGIVAPLFRFVSSSEPVSYEYQNWILHLFGKSLALSAWGIRLRRILSDIVFGNWLDLDSLDSVVVTVFVLLLWSDRNPSFAVDSKTERRGKVLLISKWKLWVLKKWKVHYCTPALGVVKYAVMLCSCICTCTKVSPYECLMHQVLELLLLGDSNKWPSAEEFNGTE